MEHLLQFPLPVLKSRLPRYLDERLAALGVRVRKAALPGMPFVIEDRELLTAQDPFAAQVFAERCAARLGRGKDEVAIGCKRAKQALQDPIRAGTGARRCTMPTEETEIERLPGRVASYWIESAPGPEYPAAPTNFRADVAVIGGGVVRVTAAALLKRAGGPSPWSRPGGSPRT